jgi:hypothetical protein
MSEVKPVSIKTWQEHLTNVFYSDSDETQCRDKEVAELRAALEALQAENAELRVIYVDHSLEMGEKIAQLTEANAAQAKRIAELEAAAKEALNSIECSHRPPVPEFIPCGTMVRVGLHELAYLHKAIHGQYAASKNGE